MVKPCHIYSSCRLKTNFYGDRSKTLRFKFSLRVCGELWSGLKPASRKFRARPAQGFAQGNWVSHAVSQNMFS